MSHITTVDAVPMVSGGIPGGPVVDPPPPSGGAVTYSKPAWAAEWMVGRDEVYTATKAAAIAVRYDTIAGYEPLQPYLAAMRAANPAFRIFYYNLGPFANTRQSGAYPEEWFAHDAAGARIMTRTFGTYLMNYASPGWRGEMVRLAELSADSHGYDGPFLDSMGSGAIGGSYVSAAPVDPRTGQLWTALRWNQDAAEVIEQVKAATGMPVLVNGLGDGTSFFSRQTKLLGYAADAAMSERWLRDPKASALEWPSLTQWREDLDMIADLEANGSALLAVTKMWCADNTPALADQWYRLAEATLMLGTSGRSRLFFLKDGAAPATNGGVGASGLETQPSPDLAIGTPTAPYSASGSCFARPYTAGYVIVNPGTTTQAVPLPPGTYTRPSGSTVSSSVSVPPHTGLVLTA